MTIRNHSILVLGLGNDILGDDGVGLLAARELKKQIENLPLDVSETALAGFELLDMLQGYEKVLILDAVVTKKHQPGTVLELSAEQFKHATAVSPHYGGLPEVLKLAEKLQIEFPTDIRILAVEIEPPYQLREGLSSVIQSSISNLIQRAKEILHNWNES
jgi:hydrogenase maturation protease